MVVAKVFIYSKKFDGEPELSNFELIEEELPPIQNGEVLIESLFLSVDPYMRMFMDMFHKPGDPMAGGQIAKVLESSDDRFPVGAIIFAPFGWRTHTIFNPEKIDSENRTTDDKPMLMRNFGNLPYSLGLGYLGQIGYTGYFGFLEICKPQANETVVITAAAGAVGSLVGQIAKIKGCRVIGFAGTDEKCQWLENELGFDKAINYKSEDLSEKLKEAAPNGIDCYFDNVGGEISATVIDQMNENGRIAVCGSISTYNDKRVMVPAQQFQFIMKQLKMEGFTWRWIDRWSEAIDQIRDWISEGKIKYYETITEGFENQPKAFIEMMKGGNVGKAIVKV